MRRIRARNKGQVVVAREGSAMALEAQAAVCGHPREKHTEVMITACA